MSPPWPRLRRASCFTSSRTRSPSCEARRAKQDGGDGGIRTLDRALQPYNGLANRRLQPLGHVSNMADMPDAGSTRKRQICPSRTSATIGHNFSRNRSLYGSKALRPLATGRHGSDRNHRPVVSCRPRLRQGAMAATDAVQPRSDRLAPSRATRSAGHPRLHRAPVLPSLWRQTVQRVACHRQDNPSG